MTNEAADILRKAKELIETKGWTQKVFALDANGEPCWMTADIIEAGVCFCSVGAVLATGDGHRDDVYPFLDRACGGEVTDFNDSPGRTKEEVLLNFDRAIALAEAGNNA